MQRQGQIVRWEAERGFGFIRSPQVPADVFVHLRDFEDRGVVPRVGLAVQFEEIHVGGKGPRAVAVRAQTTTAQAGPRTRAPSRPRARAPSEARPSSAGMGVLWFLIYASLLAWAVATGRLPPAVPVALAGLSVLTFVVYGVDKQAARTQSSRTPENTLHLLSLAGGWPGAWCAQRAFRHKSSKASFLAAYRATVWLHSAGVVAWLFWLGRA